MVAHLEWVDAQTARVELLDYDGLSNLALEEVSGPFGLVMRTGVGEDGAVLEGGAEELAAYLMGAVELLRRRVGLPTGCVTNVAELVNRAADDVLERLREAGVDASAGLVDLLVNVIVARAQSTELMSVDEVIRVAWPDDTARTVLGWCAE